MEFGVTATAFPCKPWTAANESGDRDGETAGRVAFCSHDFGLLSTFVERDAHRVRCAPGRKDRM